MGSGSIDDYRQGLLLYSKAISVRSAASEEYIQLIEELSFAEVWEQRYHLIDLMLEHVNGCLAEQMAVFREENTILRPELPTQSTLPSQIGYQLQFLFNFLIMPISIYALSLSRDYQNRYRGDLCRLHNMAVFKEHSSMSKEMSADLLLTPAQAAVSAHFCNAASVYMYAYTEYQYKDMCFAYKLVHYADITPEYYVAHCSFRDAKGGYKDMRAWIDTYLADLIRCSLYVQALAEADIYPYLLYETGDECMKRVHSKWHHVILPVADPQWDVLLPGNQRYCDCRLRQITEQEALEYTDRKDVSQKDYLDWVTHGFRREFSSETLAPYPFKVTR